MRNRNRKRKREVEKHRNRNRKRKRGKSALYDLGVGDDFVARFLIITYKILEISSRAA